MKKNSLRFKLWLYFSLFSLLILFVLWLIQVFFLDKYYEWSKNKELKKAVNKIDLIYDSKTFNKTFDELTLKKDLCIEIFNDNEMIYSSGNRGCLLNNRSKEEQQKRISFINGDKKQIEYEIKNPFYDNKILVYGIKLNDGNFAFISVSLDPIDSTLDVIAKQYKYAFFGAVLFSFVIAYFVSKRICNPILRMNAKTKLISKGDYTVTFDENAFYEISELSKTLNNTTVEHAKTEELRRDLLANVSHDLKTPLTIIKANAEMVKDVTYKNEDKRNDNLNLIMDEVDRLNMLVEDIRDVSKARSNNIQLKKETFNLNSLIHDILSRFKIICENDSYKIEFNYDCDYYVEADKKRIEQVIYNLINNAVNYTGEDKRIIISLNQVNDKVLVKVKDTGRGIDKQDLKHIWDKYYKADKRSRRVTKGTGLGLYIVKSILELHNFEYGVETKKNEGATFYFYMNINKII